MDSISRQFQASPEVKSYIYQQLVEFDPFITPQTQIGVFIEELDSESESSPKYAGLFKAQIVMMENGTQIQEEALAKDVFEAIRLVKESMVQKLAAIQDSVVSNQDRAAEIRAVMKGHKIH